MGKLLIIGTQLDITERLQMVKKTQELMNKRELAMRVSNIIHWDFDVRTQKFESYHDPINDYASDKQLTIAEYMEVIHPDDRSAAYDAMQSMLSGKEVTINFTCRIQTKYDDSWQYCNILGVPFEKDEDGNNIRFTGFRQNISKLHQLDEEVKERNYKMELTFKTVGMSYWDFDVATRQFKAFNDPVNDYHPERTITPNDYMEVTHPEDLDNVCKYIDYMLQRTDKEFSFQYRSKSKWENDWQTLIVTGIPVKEIKKKRHPLYRYQVQQHEMGKDGAGTERAERKSGTLRPAQICLPGQYESRDTYAFKCYCRFLRSDGTLR